MRISAAPALLAVLALAACSKGESAVNGASLVSAAQAATLPVAATSQQQTPDPLTAAADKGRIGGAETAKVWLIVVSDFQCPFCKTWHDQSYPTLKKDYIDSGKIRIAHVNFPLRIHPNATPAALVAMCASAQGKFWQTHDRIFASQDAWKGLTDPNKFLDSVAVASGVDAAKLKECRAGDKLMPLIKADQANAQQSGAQSTPTFFVNGRPIIGAQPVGVFKKVIDSVLAATPK